MDLKLQCCGLKLFTFPDDFIALTIGILVVFTFYLVYGQGFLVELFLSLSGLSWGSQVDFSKEIKSIIPW